MQPAKVIHKQKGHFHLPTRWWYPRVLFPSSSLSEVCQMLTWLAGSECIPYPFRSLTSLGPGALMCINTSFLPHCMTAAHSCHHLPQLTDPPVNAFPCIKFPQAFYHSRPVVIDWIGSPHGHSNLRSWTLGVQCGMFLCLWRLPQTFSQSEWLLIALVLGFWLKPMSSVNLTRGSFGWSHQFKCRGFLCFLCLPLCFIGPFCLKGAGLWNRCFGYSWKIVASDLQLLTSSFQLSTSDFQHRISNRSPFGTQSEITIRGSNKRNFPSTSL